MSPSHSFDKIERLTTWNPDWNLNYPNARYSCKGVRSSGQCIKTTSRASPLMHPSPRAQLKTHRYHTDIIQSPCSTLSTLKIIFIVRNSNKTLCHQSLTKPHCQTDLLQCSGQAWDPWPCPSRLIEPVSMVSSIASFHFIFSASATADDEASQG